MKPTPQTAPDYSGMVIYKVTNTVNGKCYIGQTVRFLKRKADHSRRHSQCICLRAAIARYGLGSFEFCVIDHATTKDELNQKEAYWIKQCNSKAPNGYNLTDGGDGTPGHAQDESTRAKIRAKAIGRKLTMKRHVSPEFKGPLSGIRLQQAQAKIIARNKSAKGRQKSSAHMTALHEKVGKGNPTGALHHSEESLARMREVRRQFWDSEQGAMERQRRIDRKGTVHFSDEARKNMSEGRKRFLATKRKSGQLPLFPL